MFRSSRRAAPLSERGRLGGKMAISAKPARVGRGKSKAFSSTRSCSFSCQTLLECKS